MFTIDVPAMAVSRDMADRAVEKHDLKGSTEVRVDGRNLDINTSSFVSQLVKRLADVGIQRVEIVGGGQEWYQEISAEATSKGIRLARP